MTAPERIWAFYSDIFGAMWTGVKDEGADEYIRADLIPATPLSAALAVPEVAALVVAARAMRDHLDRWQETGAIATAEESKALHDGLYAALRGVEDQP